MIEFSQSSELGVRNKLRRLRYLNNIQSLCGLCKYDYDAEFATSPVLDDMIEDHFIVWCLNAINFEIET